MEVNRKTVTNETIRQREMQTIEDIKTVTEEYSAKFAEFGYELATDMYYLESEYDRATHELSDSDDVYTPGYVSQAKITVRKIDENNEDDEEAEAETAESEDKNSLAIEAVNPEEASEIEPEEAEEEEKEEEEEEEDYEALEAIVEENAQNLKRSFAYTIVLMLRIYKSFWKEIVEFSDGTDTLRADLDEFLAKLADDAKNADDI